jgi:hypothetical protein
VIQTAAAQEVASSSLLNERGVSIATGTVVINGKTFIAKNITSVRAEYGRKASKPGAIVCAVVAVALFVSSQFFLGSVVAFAALFFLTHGASKLFITTAGGESMALESKDATFVSRVHDAAINVSSR